MLNGLNTKIEYLQILRKCDFEMDGQGKYVAKDLKRDLKKNTKHLELTKDLAQNNL